MLINKEQVWLKAKLSELACLWNTFTIGLHKCTRLAYKPEKYLYVIALIISIYIITYNIFKPIHQTSKRASKYSEKWCYLKVLLI